MHLCGVLTKFLVFESNVLLTSFKVMLVFIVWLMNNLANRRLGRDKQLRLGYLNNTDKGNDMAMEFHFMLGSVFASFGSHLAQPPLM